MARAQFVPMPFSLLPQISQKFLFAGKRLHLFFFLKAVDDRLPSFLHQSMKTLLLLFVLNLFGGSFSNDQFTLNVNGDDCSFPSDALLFPGRDTICGLVPPSDVFNVELTDLSLTLSLLSVGNVRVAFAMSDVSNTRTSATSRTWVSDGEFFYGMRWRNISTQTWGFFPSQSDSTALWFGSVGDICPLQMDFWRFDIKLSQWELDVATCVVQFGEVAYSYVYSISSNNKARYIGIGTQGTPSPSPKLWDKG